MKKKQKRILYVISIILILIACFRIDADRKPHFKVIRGNYTVAETLGQTETKININTASIEELDQLVGIGPTIAERIVIYRNNKPFSSIREIMNVKGIGEKKYEAIKDFITIN